MTAGREGTASRRSHQMSKEANDKSSPQARNDGVTNQARDKAIDVALAAIDKQFGKGAIMRLGKDPIDREVQVVPSGSLGLDLALGIGGLPRGRIVEIYGPESSGKTTLTLHIIAEAQ